jgi:hypothetical protein
MHQRDRPNADGNISLPTLGTVSRFASQPNNLRMQWLSGKRDLESDMQLLEMM